MATTLAEKIDQLTPILKGLCQLTPTNSIKLRIFIVNAIFSEVFPSVPPTTELLQQVLGIPASQATGIITCMNEDKLFQGTLNLYNSHVIGIDGSVESTPDLTEEDFVYTDEVFNRYHVGDLILRSSFIPPHLKIFETV